MKQIILSLSFLVVTFSLSVAQETENIKSLRDEQIKKWETDKVPQVKEIIDEAKTYLALPIEKQSINPLEEIADKTNMASNFVDFILGEYRDYYSDNYQYDFVLSRVASFHDGYVKISNELRDYRNKAFFNIGVLHKKATNYVLAFFYFRDAFRLSSFTESEGDHIGIRYKAEIEMKELLGIKELGTYIYWQD